MDLEKVKHLTAMVLIGDGVTALVRPHRDAFAWNEGPTSWRHLMRFLDERPLLTRFIGAAEITAGLIWLGSKKPVNSTIGRE